MNTHADIGESLEFKLESRFDCGEEDLGTTTCLIGDALAFLAAIRISEFVALLVGMSFLLLAGAFMLLTESTFKLC